MPDAPGADGGGDDFTIDDLPAEAGSVDPCSDMDSGDVAATPLAEQAVVELEADVLAHQWAMGDRYTQPVFDADALMALPLLAVTAMRAAALTFPAGTGLGGDNVSPRALARLSDESLIALAIILAAAETLGAWGQAVSLVLIVLLPKPDVGLRPIGFFPTIVRL